MAKILTEDVLKALKKFDLPKGYQRTGEFPLDPSSVFGSKADADLYAAGGEDSRGLSGTRYAGQLIAVVEGGVTTLYTVEANDTLKAVGGDVTADLADLTSKVNAVLDGVNIDSFKDVEDALAALPKDMVVSGGEVRKPTTDEIIADEALDGTKEYIILTIKNAEEGKDKLFIAADKLVDVYTSGDDYIGVSDYKITANVSAIEAKLVADDFAKKSDITDITNTLATAEALNAVKSTADGAASKAEANEGKIGTLENIVGKPAEGEEEATGLVKNISDLSAKITEVENTVGTKADASAVETLTTNLTTVQGEITTLKTNVSDIKVKDVDVTASNGVALTFDETSGKVGVEVTPADITKTVKQNLDLKSSEVKLSAAIGGTEEAPTYAADSTVQSVLAALDARITTNANSIEAAVAGGVVSIGAGDGISVDASRKTAPVVSVHCSETGGLEATEAGVGIKISADSNFQINAAGNLDLVWLDDTE